MKANIKKLAVLIFLLIILLVIINCGKSKDLARDIETSRFTIIQPIEAPNIWPVYLAAYNTCNPNPSFKGHCSIECGFGDLQPCYFFNYDSTTQKPHVIASYYSRDDALYQTLIKFKDRNTIQFKTMKGFVATSSDSHYIFYTKELDLQTGKIITVKAEETYEPYESYP